MSLKEFINKRATKEAKLTKVLHALEDVIDVTFESEEDYINDYKEEFFDDLNVSDLFNNKNNGFLTINPVIGEYTEENGWEDLESFEEEVKPILEVCKQMECVRYTIKIEELKKFIEKYKNMSDIHIYINYNENYSYKDDKNDSN